MNSKSKTPIVASIKMTNFILHSKLKMQFEIHMIHNSVVLKIMKGLLLSWNTFLRYRNVLFNTNRGIR